MSFDADISLIPRKCLPSDPRVSAVLAHFEAWPLHSLPTARLLAQQLDMSESCFRYKFKQTAGVAFGQYVGRLRFQRAKMLLQNTTMSVKQAMLEVGMNDHSSFARRYKRYFGETPSRTRNSAGGKWNNVLFLKLKGSSEERKLV